MLVRLSFLLSIPFVAPTAGQLQRLNENAAPLERRVEEAVDWVLELDLIPTQPRYRFIRLQHQEFTFPGQRTVNDLYLEVSRDSKAIKTLRLDLTPRVLPVKEQAPFGYPVPTHQSQLDLQKAQLLFRKNLVAVLQSARPEPDFVELVSFLAICRKTGKTIAYDKLLARMHDHKDAFRKLSRPRIEEALEKRHYRAIRAELMRKTGRDSRNELLERTNAFLRTFPTSASADDARKLAGLLQQSIADEKQHPEKPAAQLEEMAKQKDVKGLIQQLQYVSATPRINGVPGNPVFGSEDNVAHQLLSLGVVAIPDLLDAVKDDRLTYVGTALMDDGYWRVLSVGEVAAQILDELMPGEELAQRLGRTALFSPKPHLAAIEKQARAWWKRYQATPPAEFWASTLERADEWSFRDAAVPTIRYVPEQASEILEPRLSKQNDNMVRILTQDIVRMKPLCFERLLTRLQRSDRPMRRLYAVTALLEAGCSPHLSGFWNDWDRHVADSAQQDPSTPFSEYVMDLPAFLMRTGPAAIKRIATDLPSLSARDVWLVLSHLPTELEPSTTVSRSHWRNTPRGRAVILLLLKTLNDKRRLPEPLGGLHRVCDCAAPLLGNLLEIKNLRLPNREPKSDTAELDRQSDVFVAKIRAHAEQLVK